MRKLTAVFLATMTALSIAPAASFAAPADSLNQGYLQDSSAGFVTNASGQCWRTSDWTPARAMAPCDPVLKMAAAAVPAPMPTPAAVAPIAPLPIAAPVAAAPMTQKISFSGDALFGFDTAVLRPESQTLLDGLVTQVNGASYETIAVTGHTDRFGSSTYNQKLSEQRAQSVKSYLVSKNIQANRIDAIGKGETQPITPSGVCKGAQTAKVIACLQPDRRVDIEMTGSKK
jgi:OOP family OmpA-OmpF porin